MSDFSSPLIPAIASGVEAHFPHLTSLLVSRGGQLVHAQCLRGDRSTLREIQSITKSIVALLTGNRVPLQQKVLEVFPEHHAVVTDARWEQVTVGHLLGMTSGLPSELTDEAYDEKWFTSPDPTAFTLSQTLLDNPGQTFHYSNAGFHLLGHLLEKTTGMKLQDLAQETLFRPLGLKEVAWDTDSQGRVFGSGGLRLRVPDLLNIGQLVLQQGHWQGEQVVSGDWIQQITLPRTQGYLWMENLPWYGLGWWVTREHNLEAWYATGFGGQYLAVFPEVQLVVAVTGEVSMHPSHRQVVHETVLPVLLEQES